MAFARRFSGWLAVPFLAACSAVSPDPSKATIDDLPEVTLSEADRARCDELEAAAIDAVVRRRYEQAEQLADQVLAVQPRSGRARAVLGMVRLQMAARQQPSDWRAIRQGEVEMELARQLEPKSAFVGWMHAVFLAESGHMSAAAAAAEAALERSVDAPASERAALLGTAGTYRYELGEERAARPHLEAYVGLRPDDSAAHFRLGSCLLSIAKTPQGSPPPYGVAQAEAEAAAVAFARCFELAPGDEDAALAVATAWIRAAELADLQKRAAKDEERDALYDKARSYLQDLAKQFPSNAEVYFHLGVLASTRDQEQEAQVAYLAALDRDRNHLGSLLNLASLMVAQGELEPARSLLLRAVADERAAGGLTGDERERILRWLRELREKADAASSESTGG